MFVCGCVCNKQSVHAPCALAYRWILLTRSLNNKTNIAALTLDPVSVEWCSLFQLPQNSNAPTMRLNTPRCQTTTPMGAQMGANAFAI